MVLPGYKNDKTVLLSGRRHNDIIRLPGQYCKYAYLPSISDSFSIRIPSSLSGDLFVGSNAHALLQKLASGKTAARVRADFIPYAGRTATLGAAIVGAMVLGTTASDAILGSSVVGSMTLGVGRKGWIIKDTNGDAELCVSGVAASGITKNSGSQANVALSSRIASVIGQCSSGAATIKASASASCMQFRPRTLGDLQDMSFVDLNAMSMREFYYTPYTTSES